MSDTHTHEPSEPIAAFWFTCKHCGRDIESKPCPACAGSGIEPESWIENLPCKACKGSGTSRWVEVK